jgi:hypothetical protein
MSLCLADGTFGTYCDRTWHITMRPARICRWIRTHRFRAKFKASGGYSQSHISADCITSTFGSDLR